MTNCNNTKGGDFKEKILLAVDGSDRSKKAANAQLRIGGGVDKPEDQLLSKSYKNSLQLADDEGIKSIAFPAISTGAFGYPIKEAAEISLRSIKNIAKSLDNLKLIRFVLYNESDLQVYQSTAKDIYIL